MTKTILLAAMLAMGMSASAQDKKGNADVSFSGEYRLRYTNNLNSDGLEDGAGSEAATQGRFKLGTTFRMGEKLSGHATLLFGHTFGQNGDNGSAVSPDQSLPPTTNPDDFGMSEAFAKWMMADNWSLQAGRFGYQLGDGKVLSIDDYQQKPNSMEGVVIGWDNEWAKVSILGFEHYDWGITAPDQDDKDAYTVGLSVDVKNTPEWLKLANVHVLQNSTDESATPARDGESVMRYGVSLGGAWTALDWGFTYASHSGENTTDSIDLVGSMMDVNVGWTFTDLMKLKVFVGMHQDSGDDNATDTENGTYAPWLYDTHEYAGLQDIVGWGNLTDTSFGLSLDPMDNMTVALVYHMFAATEELGGQTLTGYTVATATETGIGSEIDLSVWHKYDNGLNVGARYSTFTPGDRLKSGAVDANNSDQLWLQGSASF